MPICKKTPGTLHPYMPEVKQKTVQITMLVKAAFRRNPASRKNSLSLFIRVLFAFDARFLDKLLFVLPRLAHSDSANPRDDMPHVVSSQLNKWQTLGICTEMKITGGTKVAKLHVFWRCSNARNLEL